MFKKKNFLYGYQYAACLMVKLGKVCSSFWSVSYQISPKTFLFPLSLAHCPCPAPMPAYSTLTFSPKKGHFRLNIRKGFPQKYKHVIFGIQWKCLLYPSCNELNPFLSLFPFLVKATYPNLVDIRLSNPTRSSTSYSLLSNIGRLIPPLQVLQWKHCLLGLHS